MDNLEQNSDSQVPPVTPEEELTHTDKMTGIFTEPAATFEKISRFPLKTVDWLLPILIFLLVVAATRILVLSNEEIAYQERQKQIKQVDELVEEGVLSREQADQQIEQTKKFSDSPIAYVFMTVSILFGGFIFFFIIVLFYFLLSRFALKGNGGYTSALVANGLPAYISLLQIVLAAILSLTFERLLNDVSIASLANIDKSTITGWALGKLDPFSIWVYSVLSIGLAKLFRSDSTKKYFIMVFSFWILGSLLLWAIGRAVPFLSFLSQM
jgi:hypothetical protein